MSTTTAPARHIAIYTRISQDKEKDHRAVSRQKADCEALIKRLVRDKVLPKGLRIEHYSDNSESAFKENQRKKRTEFARMLADAEAGYIEAIVAYHSDRLYRRVPDLYDVARAVKKHEHLTVQTVKSGSVDFSTPVGRLAAVMLAAIAEYEIEIKSVRQMSESDQIAETGDPRRGGRRPYGYDKDVPGKKGKYVVINEAEAENIRDAARRILDKDEPVTSILKDWRRRKITTVTGKAWHHSTFIDLMTRYRNAGIRQHRGENVGMANWPAILDMQDFDDLRKKLLDPSRITSTDKTRKHLLSFIVTCGRCGVGLRAANVKVPYQPVNGPRRKKEYSTYQCPGHLAPADDPCRLSIMKYVAENAVRGFVADRLVTPDEALLAVHDAERVELRRLLDRRAELDGDERVIEQSKISMASKARQLETVNAERVRLDAQAKSIRERVALAALLTEAVPRRSGKKSARIDLGQVAEAKAAAMVHFDNLSLEQRREIIRALCHVVIEPSVKGVSYKYGKAYQRVLIYPRDPVTGTLADDPIRGTDLVGKFDTSGRMIGFTYDES